MNPYEVLGIPDGADEKQIKRAYFRLLRQYSPEQDPEGFARIREAYERLKEQPEEGPAFQMPDRPYVRQFQEQIENCIRRGNYDLARETAEEGWQRFPGTLYFLYQMTFTQRLSGYTGKAVKSGALLVEKEPQNKWFWREYALANYERGYIKKAYPVFQKAWELGCRDMEFILLYSGDCRDVRAYENGMQLLWPFTDPAYSWKKDDMYEAIDVFTAVAWFAREMKANRDEAAERYCAFLKRYRVQLTDLSEDCVNIMAEMFGSGMRAETYRSCMQTMQSFLEADGSRSAKEAALEYMRWLPVPYMNSDENMCRSLRYRNEVLAVQGETMRFGRIDSGLCMIEERELILEKEEYIRETYPEFYSALRPFLDRIRTENGALSEKQRLLRDLRKQMEFYEDCNYFKWYPDKREEVFGRQRPAVRQESTFVRQGKKIGRNDPCPCGSGKKYKQCCGR